MRGVEVGLDPGPGNDQSGLFLRVLGEMAAARDGHPLVLGGRQQRAVLAVLVVAPR